MNPLNYATLEASKRLLDAGIVLETEVYHVHNKLRNVWSIRPLTLDMQEHPEWWEWVPAPSMAEVWRELPDHIGVYVLTAWKALGVTLVGYEHRDAWEFYVKDTNPTDALIGLLIWVTEQRKEKT